MGYRYSRWRPSPTRMGMDEMEGHKFGYTIRIDPAADPANRKRYLGECTCGWKDSQQRWTVTKRTARLFWQGHMADARRQATIAYGAVE